MALVEIVVVEPQEGIFLFVGQHLEDGFVDDAQTRMVHLCLVGVFDEEHVADEAHETITNPQAVLVATFGKIGRHLALVSILVAQVVEIIGLANEEIVTHILRVDAEDFVDESVVDERTRIELFAERQSEVFYLVNGQRQRGREMAQHSGNGIDRNLPDAEETQYVINAQGVEILLHVAQATTEPFDEFRTPMIGRESPILTLIRIQFWRCPS